MPTSTSVQPVSAVPQPKSRRRRHTLLIRGAAATLAVGAVAATVWLGSSTETRTASYAGVESIVIDLGAGGITLTGTAGQDVAVRTTLHSFLSRDPVYAQSVTDGVLTITGSCPPPSINCGVDEELTVPAGVSVTVRMSAGEIHATGLDVPRFQAAIGAGRIEAAFVRPPDLVDINTETGEVTATVPDVGYRIDAVANTGTTDIDLRQDHDANRSLRVRAGTGSVTLDGI
jgi:hypothetical protein